MSIFSVVKQLQYHLTTARSALISRYTSIMNQLGVTEIQILEQNGTSWRTVEIYRYQDYPNLMGSNTLRHTGSITFPGIAGRTYVAHITFYAANAKGSETQVITTSSVTAY